MMPKFAAETGCKILYRLDRIAHYVRADGTGGTVISENSDAGELHEVALAYSQWLQVEIIPIVTIDAAVPTLLTYFG